MPTSKNQETVIPTSECGHCCYVLQNLKNDVKIELGWQQNRHRQQHNTNDTITKPYCNFIHSCMSNTLTHHNRPQARVVTSEPVLAPTILLCILYSEHYIREGAIRRLLSCYVLLLIINLMIGITTEQMHQRGEISSSILLCIVFIWNHHRTMHQRGETPNPLSCYASLCLDSPRQGKQRLTTDQLVVQLCERCWFK